jgi:molybdate transport system substrate-binding protein
VQPGSRSNFAGNRLVLVSAAGSPLSLQAAPRFDLAGALGASGRLAVADVRTVPAGRYARAALESLGVWSSVSQRLAMTENVRAALLLVARGEAPLGIVYATDASSEPKVKVVARFPDGSHPPIIYPFAVTTGSGRVEAARQFIAALAGARARAIFEAQGFTVLVAPTSTN